MRMQLDPSGDAVAPHHRLEIGPAKGTQGTEQVQGLKDVRLASTVVSVQDCETRAKFDLGILEVAKVDEFELLQVHRRACGRTDQIRIGMTTARKSGPSTGRNTQGSSSPWNSSSMDSVSIASSAASR